MSNIPFLYINVAVLSCFALMFVTILAVKKTPEIWAFLAVLLDAILWAGGSVLMRLQIWPGLSFWYKVSLLALFIMELLFYIFVHTFAHRKGRFPVTAFVLWNGHHPQTLSGFFTAPPTPVVLENRGHGFYLHSQLAHRDPLHHVRCHHRRDGGAAVAGDAGAGDPFSGYPVIVTGGLVMLAGNLLQVGIPGNVFPFDMVSGLVFALLLMAALYKRRMFRMTWWPPGAF